jgi:hypothetical protein
MGKGEASSNARRDSGMTVPPIVPRRSDSKLIGEGQDQN